MQEKSLYDYAVIRVLPRVDREEFMNVGVIVYSPDHRFLRADCSFEKDRLRSFSPELDLEEVAEHLGSICRICEGGDGSGAIGKLPIGERFRWLTAPRSTIVQTSAVHTGFTSDPEKTLQELLDKLVRIRS